MTYSKILVFHFFKRFVFFDRIFDNINDALDFIKSKDGNGRKYSCETVDYRKGEPK